MRMESCFAVASVIFKKFEPILNDMFKNSVFCKEGTPEKAKSSRTRFFIKIFIFDAILIIYKETFVLDVAFHPNWTLAT